MIGAAWPLLRPLLHSLDAERAHEVTLAALERLPLPQHAPHDPRLATRAFGLDFPNPLGLAAGFDKDARVPRAMLRLGFGFAEVGTVTPLPQPGNDRPRIFRLAADRGVINRLGFNNGGQARALRNLERLQGRAPGPIGVNIGANKESRDRAADYVRGVHAFAPVADYITVNISSPNTPGLRDLQARSALDDLLARLVEARDRVARAGEARRPLLLKIAPDLELGDLDDVVDVVLARGVDGLIVSNTTVSRPAALASPRRGEAGGLSGQPAFRRTTWMLAQAYRRVGERVPLVGVGGIATASDALQKIRAGATLLQVYTALIYQGPALIGAITKGLAQAAQGEGGLAALRGCDADALAKAGPGA